MVLTYCSIATPARQAAARVLAEDLQTHQPSARVLSLEATGEPAAVPRALARALEDDCEAVIYLDPQSRVYGPLDAVLELLGTHTVVLLRRVGALPDDGQLPDQRELLHAGRISDAFVAVRRSAPADRFVRWWASRLESSPRDEERWLDLAPDFFAEVAILDDPGYGVSYWNLHERPLERDGDAVLAAGRPLRLMHFAGFRADRPYWLSQDGNRVRVVEHPVLAELCGEHAERLLAAGWSPSDDGLADVGVLGNGQPIDQFVRDLWREAAGAGRRFGDPLSPSAADAFVDWIRGPAEVGADQGVNRYLLAAYRRRPDLQEAIPDLGESGAQELIEWASGPGAEELLAELIPSGPGTAATAASRLGVNVIGYLGDTLGLAEAARQYVSALAAAGLPVTTTAIRPDLPVSGRQPIGRSGSQNHDALRASVEPAFNLVCINGDQLQDLMRQGGREMLAGRPTIGVWAWETDVLPPSWNGGFQHLDEIWVNSTFVAENLGRLSPVPIVVVPQAMSVPDTTGVELALPWDDRFTFLFMLDFFSTLQRKNPLGLIEAFTRAFAPGEGPRLLFKTINQRFRREAAEELRSKLHGRRDIELIDSYLEPLQKYALMARADCYVSLHRSEGFGLTLAESMALGTPAIGTGYSGNTDFMTSMNSYLVDWTPTRVGPDCDIYPAHGSWAEPDLDHAAELMRHVWEHPQEAAAKARRARADIQRLYAPRVAGAVARARLERLLSLQAGGRSRTGGRLAAIRASTDENIRAAQGVLAVDPRRGLPPVPRGAKGLLRRLVLRVITPFTYHERKLDQAMLDAISGIRTELEEEQERSRLDGLRLRRVEDTLAADAPNMNLADDA